MTAQHRSWLALAILAGIAIGVGIDYAIHFMTWWQKRDDGDWAESARTAAEESEDFRVTADVARTAMRRAPE